MTLKNCRSTLAGSIDMSPQTPVRASESWDSRYLTVGVPAEMPPPRRPGGRAGSTASASDKAVDPVTRWA